MLEKKEGTAIKRDEFFANLITTKDTVEYVKKVDEPYNPEEEFNAKMYDYVREEKTEENNFDVYDVTKIQFSYKRINQKFNKIAIKYGDIVDRETLFGFANDIITEYIYSLERDNIYIATKKVHKKIRGINKLGYFDDITTINVMLDTRINNYINDWLGTYRKEENGITTYVSAPFLESLDTELDITEKTKDPDAPRTIGDMVTDRTNIFADVMSEYTNEEIDERLNKIYKKANLTNREIEVLETLERTPDNINGSIYTKALAGKILDCTGQNISNIFNRAKKKIVQAYKFKHNETRRDKYDEIDNFLDIIENEKDVINFIKENLSKEFINYVLYDSDLNCDLVKYFNQNKNIPQQYNNDLMRKFCTYFLKELYTYIKLIKYNIIMQEKPTETVEKTKKWKYEIDTNVYKYIAESKLKDEQKKGKFIVIDDERYYYIKSSKQKEKELKGNYIKSTYLKR